MAGMQQKQNPPTSSTSPYQNLSGDLVAAWPAEALLAANLAALRQRDTALAEQIAAVVIPDSVQMVASRDGSVTFRLTGPDGKRTWLGYSSLPLVSARANNGRVKHGEGNMVVNGIGHGAEVELILQDMGLHQAILVVEKELLHLNLALRLREFTLVLSTGRLVLLYGPDPVAALETFYREHPGYNLATEALTCTWLTDQENQAFGRQINAAMDRVLGEQSRAVERICQSLKEDDQQRSREQLRREFSGPVPLSFTAFNISRLTSAEPYCRSRDVLAGLNALGVKTDWQTMDRADTVSPRAQWQRLADFKPSLVVLVDALRGDMGVKIPEHTVCATVTTLSGWAKTQTSPDKLGACDVIFPVLKSQAETLRQAGFPSERVIPMPLAANTDLFQPIAINAEDRGEFSAEVALVADRPSDDPETYEIKLPTHKSLWQAVIGEIQRRAEEYDYDAAEAFLKKAQRCGVQLQEEDIRSYFVGLVQNYLGEAVLGDVYGYVLEREKINLGIWHNAPLRPVSARTRLHFWEQSPLHHRLRGSLDHAEQRNRFFNTVPIHLYIHSDGLVERRLLDGVAAGAFFLVRAHRRDRKPDGLGEYFELGKEIITFDTPVDLVRKVRHYLRHEGERRRIADAARQKLLARHSYHLRTRQMIEAISSIL